MGPRPQQGGARSGGKPQAGKGAKKPFGAGGKGGGGAAVSKKDKIAASGKKHYIPKAEYAAQQSQKRAAIAQREIRTVAADGNVKKKGAEESAPKVPLTPQEAREKEVNELHQRAKVVEDFELELGHIKEKLQNFNFEGLDELFTFVPISFVALHLPPEIAAFRSYITRFARGSSNSVVTFMKWVEWGFFVAGKGQKFGGAEKGATKYHKGVGKGGEEDGEEVAIADEEAAAREEGKAGAKRKFSAVRQAFADKVAERSHVRALLQMCQRHNSTKRKEGLHALVNHIRARLPEDLSGVSTYQELKDEVDHTVAYALSRIVLGMATENFAVVVLNCYAMYLVLKGTAISARLVLSAIDEELNITARMKAMFSRADKSADQLLNDPDFDPDEIADPTRGERNQRVAAALFTLLALIANHETKIKTLDEARRVLRYVCFCYVEHKGTRVLSGNAALKLLRIFPQLVTDASAWEALSFAFFRFPRTEYLRPEGVQILLHIINERAQGKLADAPAGSKRVDIFEAQPLAAWRDVDPLEPRSLEKLVNPLFRREQVTACHPMVHPVWGDFLSMIRTRCAAGESLRAHLTNFLHNAITPFRRGNAEIPRKMLFSRLANDIGELALQHHDEEDRDELVRLLSKTVGFGKVRTAKPTPIADLRRMPVEELGVKVRSLLRHYALIDDGEVSAATTRSWALKELRHCLAVEYTEGVEAPFVNDVVLAMLREGLYPTTKADSRSMNRCIYMFADVFSFTFRKPGAKTRLKCSLNPSAIITAYLEAEEQGKTRFNTARDAKVFRKARNKIVEALDNDANRSLLFYEAEDMKILLTLLFVVLSVDDPKNEAAESFATSAVPDLCAAFQKGDMSTIPVVLDVMMSLCMRPNAPLHVMPLMVAIRRIAIGYLTRFARFIDTPESLEMVLGPLIEAFKTEERVAQRELAAKRNKKGKKKGAAAEGDEEDEESAEEEGDASDEEDASDDDEEDSESSSSSSDEEEEGDDEEESDEEDAAAAQDDESDGTEADEEEGTEADEDGGATSSGNDDESADDEEEWEAEDDTTTKLDAGAAAELDEDLAGFVEEEAATEQYLETLKAMAGGVDLAMEYPTDTDALEKADVLRSITICWKVGVQLRTPLVVHVFQVLLAVMRNNVKNTDEVVFNAARTGVECLMLSRNRFFGSFVEAQEIALLVDDIQSYCRKMERTMAAGMNKETHSVAKEGARIKHRMGQLKTLAVSVLSYVTFLAYKNGADDEVKELLAQKFAAIYYGRGWRKEALNGLKRDMYHFRHAFAWCFLPAIVAKMDRMRAVDDVMRAHTFRGCCLLLKSFLSRFTGLPVDLKESAAAAIRSFVSLMPLDEIYDIKHTFLFEYFELVKMCLKYNTKVGLDENVARALVNEVTDADELQVTKATIRQIASMERMLQMTARIVNTKHPVSYQTIQKQHPTEWRKKKSAFYKRAAEKRLKVVKQVLATRNHDPTDFERAQKRKRREGLREVDREERKVLREQRLRSLTKEEKSERRKRLKAAKQERVAKNKQRKHLLHELRQKSFKRWREAKLADAAADAPAAADVDE